ncbi:uncharacterized protein LOC134222664 [Armigeres subalbatus]|uniref:uncharacterized protein LOC134222664 n=1 Tax=Armigeres subalbatus TaxID=124917 RepID=UPI002ED60A9E
MGQMGIDDTRPVCPFRCEEIERNQLAKEWKSWKTALEIYFEAFSISDQKVMRAKLLHFGGKQLQRVYANLPDVDKLPLVSTQQNWYDVAIEKFDEFFEPGRQYILERCRLRKIRQEKNERFAHFVMRIRQQLADCGLERYAVDVRSVLTEIFVVDIIVEGCASEELRRRILQKDVTLAEVEEMGSMMEGVEQQVKDLSSLTSKEGQSGSAFQVESRQSKEKKYPVNRGNRRRTVTRHEKNFREVTCYNCGTKGHIATSTECKARNQTCRRCQRKGHFEAVCRKRSSSAMVANPKKVMLVEDTEAVSNVSAAGEAYTQDMDEETKRKPYYCFYFGSESNTLEFKLGGVSLNMLVDSGSDVNLITSSEWEKLKQHRVVVQEMQRGAADIIKGYGSEVPLRIVGTFFAELSVGAQVPQA